jgi:hypothetical protein
MPDSTRNEAEFLLRDESGQFQPVAIGDDGIYRSKVLRGLWLQVDWFWQTPKPALVEVLREWGIL